MITRKFKNLREKLPAHCYKLIARNIDGMSSLQVRLVFYEQITDPEKVEKVIAEARNLARTIARQKAASRAIGKHKKTVKPKPTV